MPTRSLPRSSLRLQHLPPFISSLESCRQLLGLEGDLDPDFNSSQPQATPNDHAIARPGLDVAHDHIEVALLSVTNGTAPGGGLSRLNSSANTFAPKRVTIKSESGHESNLEPWKKQAPAAVSSPVIPSSPAWSEYRHVAYQRPRAVIAEAEKANKETEDKAKREAEVEVKRVEERKRKEDEKEGVRKEEEEKERKRKEAEEAERSRKEAEESEIQEPEQTTEATDEAAEEAKDKVSGEAPLQIGTALTCADCKRRPDLSGTKSQSIPAALPSALATAPMIKDIGRILFPFLPPIPT